ncbi:MAG: DUF2809 domain-containing protein [Bacteroidetes bacterium]|nr:DUF2809 domain-containing protein [Bacteroidota bacterium]
MYRNRNIYLVLTLIIVVAGLASRHFSASLPGWVHAYAGDGLWALMVFLIIGFLFTRKSSLWVALSALAFSYGIEISQLYHAPWIDTLRANRLGGLILGFGFLWSDLVCYTIGVGFGYLVEKLFLKSKYD